LAIVDRGQPEADPDHAGGIGRLGAMNAGVHAALSARRQDDLVHPELLGILAIELRRLAEREGKIGRADLDRIAPRHIRLHRAMPRLKPVPGVTSFPFEQLRALAQMARFSRNAGQRQ
jgi:hypothetical protein